MYSFQIAALNAIGQGDWSDTVSFHATAPPSNPSAFTVASQSTTSITVQWTAPVAGVGDCVVQGYRVLIEDTLQPGYQVAYGGIRSSTTTSLTLGYPSILPSRHYKLLLQAKNCGQVLSTGLALSVASGSVPSQIPSAPHLISYDTTSSMTIGWVDPPSTGGFEVLTFNVYVDNNWLTDLDPSKNTYTLTSLVLG